MSTPPTHPPSFAHPALRCPHSGRPLAALLDGRPEPWNRPLAVRGGRVLDLSLQEHYWNQLPAEIMAALLERARTEGWRAALEKDLRPRSDDYTWRYAVDERRADGLLLCDLPPAARVVDVGCGWGAVTVALARRGHTLFAVDSNLETLDFVAHRSVQEGLGDRILPLRTDPLEVTPLPLEDASCDCAILNGVLEWVGAAVEHGTPRDHQRAALGEIRRILRPEGHLYLAIESRWGLSMLLGGVDHPGTRFTSVVPRRAASWLTRRSGRGPYRTWTHGHRALGRLLREAGFTRLRHWAPFPDYRFPHSIVPLEDAALFRRWIRRPGLSPGHARLLQAASLLGLHRDAVSHFLVVARP